jgi:pimeloyl-ACP methyl ester carboxylesterase
MNPDGTVNTVGWHDFSERSVHVLAEKSKATAKAFYGKVHKFAYWDGYSTGGRQALKLAQNYPNDFDGILGGAPAINWTKFQTSVLYSQIVMKQDLVGNMAAEKLTALSQAAVNACGGGELGFVIDPLSCRYDPTKDADVLCASEVSDGGIRANNSTSTCLTLSEANAFNKFWYGQTVDGSVPSPDVDNGNLNALTGQRLWFGWTRGTDLAGIAGGLDFGADTVALGLQDVRYASKDFKNTTGSGANLWKTTFDYVALARAQAQGVMLQPQLSYINTDNPDLSAFQRRGGKFLMYHGLADEFIPVQGSISYYEKVVIQMGGINSVRDFYRFYLIPGFGHREPVSGKPFVLLPQSAAGRDEMFTVLQRWVENGTVPGRIDVTSADSTASLPLCVYPQKITYLGTGSVKAAANYTCS